jgi:CHASE2 domain-containing sensor protein
VHELTGDKKFLGSKLPHASPSPVIGNQSTAIGKLLIGLSITALLTIGKIGLEQTRFGQQLEQMTVNLLQLRLADAARGRPVRVAVVDTSGLLQIPTGTGDNGEPITPRKELAEIIGAVARSGPTAIGIDIIFQPDERGHLPADDEYFLDSCLQLKNDRGERIPTFVGIYDSIARGPAGWLGEERFGSLGTLIVVPKSEGSEPTTRIPSSLHFKGDSGDVIVPSLSSALGRAAVTNEVQRRWLGRFLHVHFPAMIESEIVRQVTLMEAHEFHIDFGTTSAITAGTIPAKRSSDLEGKASTLRGKVVLVGRGSLGKTNDVFNVPGQGNEPGIYVHAAAVNTLLETPLYTLTRAGRILADILAALVPLGVIFATEISRCRHAMSKSLGEKFTRSIAIGMAIVIVVVGYFWIDWTGILWTDFLMVIGALFLHGPAEQVIDRSGEFLKLTRRPTH